ncbi:MAG TPA: hypothetical protein VMW58_03090 [Anaerolineae bacterium]|nr:hypothetical protein [Anaerolineae bacterium]
MTSRREETGDKQRKPKREKPLQEERRPKKKPPMIRPTKDK